MTAQSPPMPADDATAPTQGADPVPDGAVTIAPLGGSADGAAFAALVWEFFDGLRARYPEMHEALDTYITLEDLAGGLDRLVTEGPPEGSAFLLARIDGEPAGCIMFKRKTADTCEMNRLFVPARARGRGIGRALALRLLEEARVQGYRHMVLDAFDRHEEALPLYRSLGFVPEPDPSDYIRSTPGALSLRLAL